MRRVRKTGTLTFFLAFFQKSLFAIFSFFAYHRIPAEQVNYTETTIDDFFLSEIVSRFESIFFATI
jgi:hypothetical protein